MVKHFNRAALIGLGIALSGISSAHAVTVSTLDLPLTYRENVSLNYTGGYTISGITYVEEQNIDPNYPSPFDPDPTIVFFDTAQNLQLYRYGVPVPVMTLSGHNPSGDVKGFFDPSTSQGFELSIEAEHLPVSISDFLLNGAEPLSGTVFAYQIASAPEGSVSAVPLPKSLMLFMSALVGLAAFAGLRNVEKKRA